MENKELADRIFDSFLLSASGYPDDEFTDILMEAEPEQRLSVGTYLFSEVLKSFPDADSQAAAWGRLGTWLDNIQVMWYGKHRRGWLYDTEGRSPDEGLEIRTIEIAGFQSALDALRLPFNLEPRSAFAKDGIHPKDLALMQALIKRGDEHAKVMRGIVVWVEINAPVYWWCEMETYEVGRQRLSSQSTMHVDCKGLKGIELQEAKATIPMGKYLKKVDYFSYQTLRRIYYQRREHRLPEWHKDFVEWIESLPYAKELIICE